MTTIVKSVRVSPGQGVWQVLAAGMQAWTREVGVDVRDAVVLLPFAQHVPLARSAWAGLPGWMPRIETTQTLTRSLAPPVPPGEGQICFDGATDRLAAAAMLRAQTRGVPWGGASGFAHTVAALVQTAHGFARAGAAVSPRCRDEHWQTCREALMAGPGPGSSERALARVALEWAALGAAPDSDALFALRPSAWLVVQAGGPDRLTRALLAEADGHGTPCLVMDTDAPLDLPFAAPSEHPRIAFAVCTGFEDEAQRTAALVLRHLDAGETPVALVAQDRVLVRRIHALLSRQGVAIQDETGWKLSTTRAATALVGLLRLASPASGLDDLLDWLKTALSGNGAVQSLEAGLRRQAARRVEDVSVGRLDERAARLWQKMQQVRALWGQVPRQPLASWLAMLGQALDAFDVRSQWVGDDAGRQVLSALRLDASSVPPLAADALALADFAGWVDQTLEQVSFVPRAPEPAQVVITPLARAMLRPFPAVVFPGTDERHLGLANDIHPLLTQAQVLACGLPGVADHREAEQLAFAQMLRMPRLTLLRRASDGDEPLSASPLVERLVLALQRHHHPIVLSEEARIPVVLPTAPVARPAPVAPQLLPTRLSASACEALRACPYRFFALRMLRLRAEDELDMAIEKRDYGTWLHEVLLDFHRARSAPASAEQEVARLQELALATQATHRLDTAEFLPFMASFERFAENYVKWLHQRDAEGAQWVDGEREFSAVPPAWGGTGMHGVIDRVDSALGDDVREIQLIDYKTGSAQALRDTLRAPQEDTQLAFYAALMLAQSEAVGEVGALYLALDDAKGIQQIPHPDVADSAHQLVQGIGMDLSRLRAGAGMPALGEGRVCDHCDARGLCRRDHWPVPPEALAAEEAATRGPGE